MCEMARKGRQFQKLLFSSCLSCCCCGGGGSGGSGQPLVEPRFFFSLRRCLGRSCAIEGDLGESLKFFLGGGSCEGLAEIGRENRDLPPLPESLLAEVLLL